MTAVFLADAALALIVLGLAAWTAFAPRALSAVGGFIGLGAAVALVWARLGAVDVALAEAAIGAGLSGALLLRHLALSSGDQ